MSCTDHSPSFFIILDGNNKPTYYTINGFNSNAYDGNGNLVTKLDNSGTTTYVYDALNRLQSVTAPGGKVTTYTFDAAGNRAAQQVTDGSNNTNTTYTYNAQNQLLSALDSSRNTVNTTSFCYDNNGNVVSSRKETTDASTGDPGASLSLQGEGQGTYSINKYDAFNQLISLGDQDSTSVYAYNGDGLRVGKTVTKDNTTTTTKFIYEYDKVVLELDGSGNQTAYNVYGGDMLISRTAGTTTLYYLYNGHGDVVNIADSTGSIVMTYDYDPFGVVTTATGNIANSYLYAGYQFDDETGLYYLNARYYDPVMARFMSADTYLGSVRDPLSLNLYTYCHNEPMMYTDPTGHSWLSRAWNVIKGVGKGLYDVGKRAVTGIVDTAKTTYKFYTNNPIGQLKEFGEAVKWTFESKENAKAVCHELNKTKEAVFEKIYTKTEEFKKANLEDKTRSITNIVGEVVLAFIPVSEISYVNKAEKLAEFSNATNKIDKLTEVLNVTNKVDKLEEISNINKIDNFADLGKIALNESHIEEIASVNKNISNIIKPTNSISNVSNELKLSENFVSSATKANKVEKAVINGYVDDIAGNAGAYEAGNVARQPIKPNEVTTFQDFVARSVVGDNLEGHEVWQHANIKENGLASERLSTDVSKNNPVIALEQSQHKIVNKAQRAFDAANQAPLENIRANSNILREAGIPQDIVDDITNRAIQHAKSNGGLR
ncbi:RHS repeat-associated core domain-containing protein [Oscillospiraceae bacterium WX1]